MRAGAFGGNWPVSNSLISNISTWLSPKFSKNTSSGGHGSLPPRGCLPGVGRWGGRVCQDQTAPCRVSTGVHGQGAQQNPQDARLNRAPSVRGSGVGPKNW